LVSLFTRASLSAAIVLVSVLLHLGLLGVIVLAERRGATVSEKDAIEVELVRPEDIPEPQKTEPPKPELPKFELPKPEAAKPEAAKSEPQKPAQPQQKPEAQAAAPKPQEQTPPPPPPQPAETPPQDTPPAAEAPAKPVPEAVSGGPSDSKAKLTPEEIAAFRAQVQKCWTLPVGLPDAMKLEAVLRVRLARNGTLVSDPELLKANASAGGPVLVGIAMKAMRECGPYRTLPVGKYNEWKVLDLRFRATGMAGTAGTSPLPRP
jgi:outer membrane biosynthesis protein TonB